MKKYSYLLLLVLALILASCSKEKNETKNANVKKEIKKAKIIQKNSNSIVLTTTDGKKIEITKTAKGFTFSNAKNEVVLVSFFATWCPPCKAEIPHLNNLQEKYKGKLKIIGVLIESNKDENELKDFINYHAINYTITNSPTNQAFAAEIGGVRNIPFMLMYDKKGDYVTHYLGAIPEEMIDSDIASALKK
ncbi:MAG: TlpA disulfide reductase family protein [Sulfurospirillum sp.]